MASLKKKVLPNKRLTSLNLKLKSKKPTKRLSFPQMIEKEKCSMNKVGGQVQWFLAQQPPLLYSVTVSKIKDDISYPYFFLNQYPKYKYLLQWCPQIKYFIEMHMSQITKAAFLIRSRVQPSGLYITTCYLFECAQTNLAQNRYDCVLVRALFQVSNFLLQLHMLENTTDLSRVPPSLLMHLSKSPTTSAITFGGQDFNV